jgi:hypothetical protein
MGLAIARSFAASVTKCSRQPKLDSTTSPGFSAGERDSTTSPTAPPSSALPSWKGGTYDFASFMRPRMYGSTDMYRLRTSTWPSASSGSSTVASWKFSAVGQPCGREARRISRVEVVGMAAMMPPYRAQVAD